MNEPDIMATKDKQQNSFTFKADVISDTANDISIDLQLTERVIIRGVGDALHVEHVGENPPLGNGARPVQVYAGGEVVNELPR